MLLALALGAAGYVFSSRYSIQIVPRQLAQGTPGVCRRENAGYAAEQLRPVLDRISSLRESFPGIGAVLVTEDQSPLIYVHGVTRPENGTPVTPDTPFYIASQTKSYIGLLAARLDREGVLPLSTSLADVWPQLTLPTPADPRHITLRDLLVHIEPFRNSHLQTRTAYVGELLPSAYPSYLSRYSVGRSPGFEYSNLGYLIYAAALEAKTGKSWRVWLTNGLLKPMGLTRTFAATSVPAAREFSWRHQWSGDSFLMMRPKHDITMHAAGGMFSSTNDVARWLQFNLRRSAPGIDASMFKLAQTPGPRLHLAFEKNFACDGYSFGQLACTYKNVRLANQTGGYLGTRSIASYLPDCGVGIAFMVNSDTLTDSLIQNLTKLTIDFLLQDPLAAERADKLVADYARGISTYPDQRAQHNAREEHNPVFGDWTWAPGLDALSRFVGQYRSDEYGEMSIQLVEGALVARIGAYEMDLVPARVNVFGGRHTPFTAAEVVAFTMDDSGKSPVTVVWNGATFSAIR